MSPFLVALSDFKDGIRPLRRTCLRYRKPRCSSSTLIRHANCRRGIRTIATACQKNRGSCRRRHNPIAIAANVATGSRASLKAPHQSISKSVFVIRCLCEKSGQGIRNDRLANQRVPLHANRHVQVKADPGPGVRTLAGEACDPDFAVRESDDAVLASRKVREPDVTGRSSAPSICMLSTLGA